MGGYCSTHHADAKAMRVSRCRSTGIVALRDSKLKMEGLQEFEAPRKKKFDKQIDSNVIIGSKGLDEGVDL